ncbi:glycosyltransferase family 2 protein [Methylobacterium oryzae CBMB20]
MITEPKLAVIITCFNYENFVGRAIQSVLDQGSDACEIVVIDDGSTDRSWSMIQQSGVPAFRIPNGGQRAACLYGLAKTRAPFLLFLDADDELLPGALARILPALDTNVAKLQFCLTCIDSGGAVLADPYPALDAFRGQDRVVNDILRSGVYRTPPTSGNVFRRDVCELLHQCEYDQAVDGVILLAAPFMGDVVSLAESLGLYRVHGRNDSGLGRVPQAATFERDLQRFQSRLTSSAEPAPELEARSLAHRAGADILFSVPRVLCGDSSWHPVRRPPVPASDRIRADRTAPAEMEGCECALRDGDVPRARSRRAGVARLPLLAEAPAGAPDRAGEIRRGAVLRNGTI